MPTRRFAGILFAVAVVIPVQPAWATEKGDQHLRFGGLMSSFAGDEAEGEEIQNGAGAFLSYEYMLSPRFGLEPGMSISQHKEISEHEGVVATVLFGPEADELTVRMVYATACANLHLTPRSRADLYAGPMAGFGGAWLSDETGSGMAGGQFVYGGAAGLDVPLGQGKWALAVSVNLMVFPGTGEPATSYTTLFGNVVEEDATPDMKEVVGKFGFTRVF
jgi:hypothetical protein